MASQWFSVVVDCEDPDTLADFWRRALDYRILYESDDSVAIGRHPESVPGIEFVRVERHMRRKSPIHMDFNVRLPTDLPTTRLVHVPRLCPWSIDPPWRRVRPAGP
jgi:hypothetical protein